MTGPLSRASSVVSRPIPKKFSKKNRLGEAAARIRWSSREIALARVVLNDSLMQWDTPRVYVACLASYNAGDLHGDWVELTGSLRTIGRRVNVILESSPLPNAEEWIILDHENLDCESLAEFILCSAERGRQPNEDK